MKSSKGWTGEYGGAERRAVDKIDQNRLPPRKKLTPLTRPESQDPFAQMSYREVTDRILKISKEEGLPITEKDVRILGIGSVGTPALLKLFREMRARRQEQKSQEAAAK